MLYSDKHNRNLINWNDMVRNSCQRNVLQIIEESYCIFISYLRIDFKFLQDAMTGICYILHSYVTS